MASILPETEANQSAHLNEMLATELTELQRISSPPNLPPRCLEERLGFGGSQGNPETPNAKQD